MSKNEEKERKNSKGQKKDNKLTKGNKKPGNDNKTPLKEEGKPDDISNAFPNFSALTEVERLAFFQALTTARKNVEKRGVLKRQRFGTVHDEYLKYFTQDEEEEKKNPASSKDTPSLKSSLTIHDGNASSCSDQSSLKFYNRNPSDGGPRMPTPLFGGTPDAPRNETEPWDQCESVIEQNTSQMVDLYLRKKKRNEAKAVNAQLVKKKLEKSPKKVQVEERKKGSPEAGKKRTENTRICMPVKTIPKVRNTPKFNALSTEEKEIFFRTLQEARESVVKKNPEKNKEILPLSAIVRKYRADGEATTGFRAAQELRRVEEVRKNLRVKVTLTSGDNERLSRSKSQVFSDTVRETTERRHKSAESLHAEGKEPSGKIEIKSKPSWNVGKLDHDSLEICDSDISTLKKGKKFLFKSKEKKEKDNEKKPKCQAKKKKKAAKQETPIEPEPSSLIMQPKITDSMKVNISNSSLMNDRKGLLKNLKKEAATLGKKRAKTEKQKKKKTKKKEEPQGEKESRKGSFFPCKVTDKDVREKKDAKERKKVKKSRETKPAVVEEEEEEEEVCEVTEPPETQVNAKKHIGKDAGSQPNFAPDSMGSHGEQGSLESEQIETPKKDVKNKEESVHEHDHRNCHIHRTHKRGTPEEEIHCHSDTETDEEIEDKEEPLGGEELLEGLSCGSLEGLLTEIAHSISNLSSIAESLEEVSASVLDEDEVPHVCEHEKMKNMPEKHDALMEHRAKEKTFNEPTFLNEKPREVEETKETQTVQSPGKILMVDDGVVEKIKRLIYYLETKVRKDGHLEKEYLQLVVDYVDYLSKILESLVMSQERNHRKVHETYTAAEVRLKFDEKAAKEKLAAPPVAESKSEFGPRSVSEQDFKKETHASGESSKTEKSPERYFEEEAEVPEVDSNSSSDSVAEVEFTPITTDERKVLTTKIRLLQDLLKQRAEFVEGSLSDYKIIHHPEAEDFVPVEKFAKPQVLTDEDEESIQQDNKMKFFKSLLRCCACGKKKTDEVGIFENLKGEAVRVEMYEESKVDPASATLNPSTTEVLKATERKKIIDKYYGKE